MSKVRPHSEKPRRTQTRVSKNHRGTQVRKPLLETSLAAEVNTSVRGLLQPNSPTAILALQRIAGNRAVIRMIESSTSASTAAKSWPGAAKHDARRGTDQITISTPSVDFGQTVQRVDDKRTTKLKARFRSAMRKKKWVRAAVVLTTLNDADIEAELKRLRKKKGKLAALCQAAVEVFGGASDRITNPIAAIDAELARVAKLKGYYNLAVSAGNWPRAAVLLNGFSKTDMRKRVARLSRTQIIHLRSAAIAVMPGWSGKVVSMIDKYGPVITTGGDTTLGSADPIPLKGLKGLERTMAEIHNSKGKYLAEISARLGIDPTTTAAVLKAESQGKAFGPTGRMIIRFENHKFYGEWGKGNKKVFRKHFKYTNWKGSTHFFRADAKGRWRRFHGNQDAEWEVFEFARALDEEAAIRSISMGAPQVMGFNYTKTGYRTAREMLDAMMAGVRPQLDTMFTFFRRTPKCMKGLKTKNYVMFAEGYNGIGQAAKYGKIIKDAEKAYKRVLKKHKAAKVKGAAKP